ncbi:MAG: hypothetical protein ABI472_23465 [Ginsengibacter sp.]
MTCVITSQPAYHENVDCLHYTSKMLSHPSLCYQGNCIEKKLIRNIIYMLTIRINEFEGYGLREFVLFLTEAEDHVFEIIIPKETTAASSNADIAWEFFVGAYIGQQLSDISSSFSYISAKPTDAGQFSFKFTSGLIDALANIIFQISGAFGNTELAVPLAFALEVDAFIVSFQSKYAACQDMFDIANTYDPGIRD